MAATASEALSTQLLLRYSGPSVEEGSMNVYDLASGLVAFSDFVVAASHNVFGGEVEVRAEVRAFSRGSFITDVMFNVVGPLATIWQTVPDAKRLLETVQQSLDLFKFLRGKAPAKIERQDNHAVAVTNNNGQITVVHIEALNLTMSDKGGDAAQAFIGKVLQQGKGIDAVSVESEHKVIARASESDAKYFGKVEATTPVNQVTARMSLMIETASFKEGNKWKFNDGATSQLIAIEDGDFLKRVDSGEPFRKGDVLVVDMRITQHQSYSGAPIKTDKVIVKVIEHQQRRGEQTTLIGP
jgi:hypothetical protein